MLPQTLSWDIFTTSQLYLTWGGVGGRETILCDILIFSRGENRLDGTIGFVRYNKLNFATDLQIRKCMLQEQEGTHMNWTCSLFSCWTPQKDNICVPQHDKGWCWKTIFIKDHWNAQALDINSDGYISKQELMIASQVSLNIQNTPIVFIISSRQQCQFQPICFS